MDNKLLTEAMSLLNQKKKALQSIFDFSKDKSFGISEDSVELICAYVEKRQEYFDIIGRVEAKLKSDDYKEILDGSIKNKDIEEVKAEIKSLIGRIVDIDRKNKIVMQQVKDKVASNLKSVRVGQRNTNRYFKSMVSYEGSMFDSKS